MIARTIASATCSCIRASRARSRLFAARPGVALAGASAGCLRCRHGANPDYEDRVLYLTLDDPLGIEPEAVDATCRYFAYEPPLLESFAVYDAAGVPSPRRFRDPAPQAEVVAIDCTDIDPDELADLVPPDAPVLPCGGGCPGTEACLDDVCVVPSVFEIDFALATTADRLGAVSFKVDYTRAGGKIPGRGERAECRFGGDAAGLALSAFCNFTGLSHGCDAAILFHVGELRAGMVTLDGIESSDAFLTCRFHTAGPTPDARDFAIDVLDASTVELAPALDSVTVSVSAVRPAE